MGVPLFPQDSFFPATPRRGRYRYALQEFVSGLSASAAWQTFCYIFCPDSYRDRNKRMSLS